MATREGLSFLYSRQNKLPNKKPRIMIPDRIVMRGPLFFQNSTKEKL